MHHDSDCPGTCLACPPEKISQQPCQQIPPALERVPELRRAWASAAELVGIGVMPEQLDALVVTGWLDHWPTAIGSRWCLTPWAVERLGLIVDEHWEKADEVWVEVPDYRPPDRATTAIWPRPRHRTGCNLDQFAAPPPTPDGPEIVRDEDGQPILLFARPLTIDPRLAKRSPRHPKRRRRQATA
jgi:hypothetical protein